VHARLLPLECEQPRRRRSMRSQQSSAAETVLSVDAHDREHVSGVRAHMCERAGVTLADAMAARWRRGRSIVGGRPTSALAAKARAGVGFRGATSFLSRKMGPSGQDFGPSRPYFFRERSFEPPAPGRTSRPGARGAKKEVYIVYIYKERLLPKKGTFGSSIVNACLY